MEVTQAYPRLRVGLFKDRTEPAALQLTNSFRLKANIGCRKTHKILVCKVIETTA